MTDKADKLNQEDEYLEAAQGGIIPFLLPAAFVKAGVIGGAAVATLQAIDDATEDTADRVKNYMEDPNNIVD